MNYASIGILAFFVHLIIHFNAIRNTHYRNETSTGRSYRWLIISVMAFYVFDALWGVLYSARLITAVFADTELYFVAMAASLFFWIRFVIHYLREKKRFIRILNAVSYLTLAFFAVSLLLNLFLPLMFWFDAEGEYHAGCLRYVSLGLQIVLFAVRPYIFSPQYTGRRTGSGSIISRSASSASPWQSWSSCRRCSRCSRFTPSAASWAPASSIPSLSAT